MTIKDIFEKLYCCQVAVGYGQWEYEYAKKNGYKPDRTFATEPIELVSNEYSKIVAKYGNVDVDQIHIMDDCAIVLVEKEDYENIVADCIAIFEEEKASA